MLQDSKDLCRCFYKGVESFVIGVLVTCKTHSFWDIVKSNLKIFFLSLLLISIIICIILLPLWVLCYIAVSLIYGTPILSYKDVCWVVLYQIFFSFPAVVTFLLRKVISTVSDDVFFTILYVQDAHLAAEVKVKQVELWMIWLKGLLKKVSKLLVVLLLCFGAVWIQLGVMAGVVGSNFLYVVDIARVIFLLITTYNSLGKEGLLLQTLIIYLFGKEYGSHFLAFVVTSIVLAKELLEPYRSRVPSPELSNSQKNNKLQFLLLGFGIGSTVMLSVPFVGLIFWMVIQGAASTLLLYFLDIAGVVKPTKKD